MYRDCALSYTEWHQRHTYTFFADMQGYLVSTETIKTLLQHVPNSEWKDGSCDFHLRKQLAIVCMCVRRKRMDFSLEISLGMLVTPVITKAASMDGLQTR